MKSLITSILKTIENECGYAKSNNRLINGSKPNQTIDTTKKKNFDYGKEKTKYKADDTTNKKQVK